MGSFARIRRVEPTGGNEPRIPSDADQRAIHILRSVMGIVSEITLDLDMTWGQVRELFGGMLFECAEDRYRTAPRVAAALDTSLRTVKQYRHRRREERAHPSAPDLNMRRRVLSFLEGGPRTMEEVEAELPLGSDVNYARAAVQSLIEDCLVIREQHSGKLQLPRQGFVPWYLRPELHPGERLEMFWRILGALARSRVTPREQEAASPAMFGVTVNRLSRARAQEYLRGLAQVIREYDEQWTSDAEPGDEGDDSVLAGAAFTLGEIGSVVDMESLARLSGTPDPRRLPFDGDVPPAYRPTRIDDPDPDA